MSLSETDVQGVFKVLGKGVFLSGLATTHSTAYENILMAIVRQLNGGTDASFDTFQSIILPANTGIKSIITKVQGATQIAQTINEGYLSGAVATSLGLTGTPTIAIILDALRGQLLANGQFLLSGGLFDSYVRTTWSYNNLPIAGTSEISEFYVTDGVI